jgi:hypothetical protein
VSAKDSAAHVDESLTGLIDSTAHTGAERAPITIEAANARNGGKKESQSRR